VDVEVLAIYPHAHYLGRDLRAWAMLPDGSERPLIWIRHWDFNWQNAYRYAEPVRLPRGSTVAMRYVYDNSAANPRNPSEPPKPVRYGGQSTDEMGNLWMQVTTATPSDLDVLRADYAIKSAERQVQGYEHLLRQRPDHRGIRRALADAYNFIGVSWRERGRPNESGEAFARAIAVVPDHAAAHNNLGSLLRAQGRAREAIQAYRRALAVDPRFADAHFNLGLALQATGDSAGARTHLREAVRLVPSSPQPANALAWVLATDRQATPAARREAIALAERAVTLTAGRDASALDTLAVALAGTGDFAGALRAGSQALAVAEGSGEAELAADIRDRLARYRVRQP
jgi:tetratricopeptide (TPR) repeat protein